MKRILVTGNAGSGKTTLASLLAGHLELPYIGMDTIVWQPGWLKTPRAERIEMESEIASQATWVVDGVSDALLNAADTVVFLDFSRLQCYRRVFKRNLPYLFRSRPGLPQNCPEIRIIPVLAKLIWRYPQYVRPRILALCRERNKNLIHVRTAHELSECIQLFDTPNNSFEGDA